MDLILAVNCGSSSLKYAAFDGERRVREGTIDRIGITGGHETHAHAVHAALDQLADTPLGAVGHRLVHGGPKHHRPSRIGPSLLSDLQEAVRFAPLHLPPALAAIEAVASRFPHLPQIACFDTDFHWGMPEVARRLPLPQEFDDLGVRRYGFHGLSYESVVDSLEVQELRRAVIAHLGNGASMCAVREGRSIDTTMAFTPAGGLVMGTRTGDIDPGVLLFMMQEQRYGAKQIDQLINRESGLLGISGITSDMRTLLASDDPRARLALEVFCTTARKFVGALAAALGGIDSLVFTGGIGEHAVEVRNRICAGLEHLGPFHVHVVKADEERAIARYTARMLTSEAPLP